MTPPLLQDTLVTLQRGQPRIQAHISASQKTAPCAWQKWWGHQELCTLFAPPPTGTSPGGYSVFCLHDNMTEAAWILGFKVSSQGHKLNLYENRLTSISLPCLPRAPLPLKGCLLTALFCPMGPVLSGRSVAASRSSTLGFVSTDTLEEP